MRSWMKKQLLMHDAPAPPVAPVIVSTATIEKVAQADPARDKIMIITQLNPKAN